MPSDDLTFAGLDFSSGRKPVTLAALDDELNLLFLESFDLAGALACLEEYERFILAISWSLSQKARSAAEMDFKKKISQAGFQPYGAKKSARGWVSIQTRDSLQLFNDGHLLSRRTLEGRIQRGLILYEQGLQIKELDGFLRGDHALQADTGNAPAREPLFNERIGCAGRQLCRLDARQ